MEEREIEIVLEGSPEPHKLLEGLAHHLELPLRSLGMSTTYDRMVDTPDMALLAIDHSLRARQKLGNVYSGNEIRLTYKRPLQEHDVLFIRDEFKLKLTEPDYGSVLQFLGSLTESLVNQRMETILEISELAREAYLGSEQNLLNVSIDECSYSRPDAEGQAGEFVLELESHGVSDELLLSAADWVLQHYEGRVAAEGKYARGLRLLGQL
ncbi:MAG: CYTH domain-containing protein [bacterium]